MLSLPAASPSLPGLCMSLWRPCKSCLIGLSGDSRSAALLACCFASSAGASPAQLSQSKLPPLISTVGACGIHVIQVPGKMRLRIVTCSRDQVSLPYMQSDNSCCASHECPLKFCCCGNFTPLSGPLDWRLLICLAHEGMQVQATHWIKSSFPWRELAHLMQV